MGPKEFQQEFGAILDILRNHSYMQYSGDMTAWKLRVRAAGEAYVGLIRKKTGLPLSADFDIIPIDEIRGPTRENARRLAGRIARQYRRAADDHPANSPEHSHLMRIGGLWHEASRLI